MQVINSLLIAAALLIPSGASADVIRVDQIGRADEVAIQRGYPSDQSGCIMKLMSEIKEKQHGKPRVWYFWWDEPGDDATFWNESTASGFHCDISGRRQKVDAP